MSKSNIGGLYLHLILLGNTSIKHHLVLHKNDNKLDNTLSNLKIVANNFELNNCLISYIAQDNIIVNNIEHPIVNNIKKTNIVIDEPAFMTHPKYGSFYYNKWYPLKYINNLKIEIIEYYEILVKNNDSEYCYIRKFLSNDNYFNYSIPKSKISQAINYNGKIMRIHILKAMLYSIFDTIEPNESIDHIDNNYKNNNITNLQWLSISDNSKKGQETTVLKTNLNGGRNGKYILIKKKNELHIKDYTKSIIIGTFRSIEYATRFIKETLNKDISNKSLASKITRAIKNPHYSVYGFHFETFINDIDSEIWKELPKNISRDDKTYNVSSFGRVRNSFGDYMFPSQNRYNIKYPYVVINYNKYPIHYLVWTAFFGEVPDNMIILHNDLAPLNENGSYRNYLEDLRIGSYSQNSQEYCLYKHFQQIIPNEMPFQQFIEKTPEISELGIKPEPTTNIGKLMAKPPKYIQYIKASDKRGSKFVIGRQCPGLTTDISSSGSKLLSDEDKFLQIIEKYDQITGSNYLKEITI
jgi:hypothetical protein